MTRNLASRAVIAVGLLGLPVAISLGFSGCNDSSTKQAKVRPPAATPTAQAVAPGFAREPLPFDRALPDYAALQPMVRPAIDILVEKVEAAYNTGQKYLKAGDPEKARAEFDRAVDLIQASGFQMESDPRLSKLVDQIGDATQAYEQAQAQNNAEEEEENPGIPAPIEEIADLTLPPGDPRLYSKVEQELIAVPHDLPLTVNDSVLQYLSYFSTSRGRAVVEHGLERAGRYNEMIRRTAEGGGCSAGFDLSGAGGERFPAASGFAGGGAGDLAVHALSRRWSTVSSAPIGLTNAAILKRRRMRLRST